MANGGQAQGTVSSGQQTIINVLLGNPNFCEVTPDILYDTASSFISPVADHKHTYQAVQDRLNAGGARMLVVGHTDDVGAAAPNQQLSERRARGALAVLAANAAEWEAIFAVERWGDADFVTMLTEVGQPADAAAVSQHRQPNAAGAARRATLFRSYFRSLLGNPATAAPVNSLSPATLGCGKQHPLGAGDHRPSRRSEFFFFSAPPGSTAAPVVNCSEYPTWLNPCAPIPLPPVAVTDFFVSETLGDDANGDGTRTRPWRTINFALLQLPIHRKSNQHLTINVLAGTYDETVDMPSDTTLRGLVVPSFDGGNVSIVLPEIRATATGRATVRFQSVRKSELRDLRVTKGQLSGVRINDARDITVSDCIINDNFAPRGGGVAIVNSERVTVGHNSILLNTAGTIATAITNVDIDTSSDINPFNRFITVFEMRVGDAHGGGVYVENSKQVVISDNIIHENTAILFGGGVAVDNRAGFDSVVEISSNQIFCNQCSHGDLTFLASSASGCDEDMGDPVVSRMEEETIDEVAQKAANILHGVGIESGVGGGVAFRHVSPRTVLANNIIGLENEPNRARRGGGVECFVGAYPAIRNNTIQFNLSSDDGGGIAVDQFDPFLPASQPTFFGFRRGTIFPRQTIELSGNTIRRNRCVSDGGGIYATGNPRLVITGDTLIESNSAGENGGGIRASYAARLTVTGARIRRNQAKTISTVNDGGGGIAARNAEVTLRDCELNENISNDFAGGAIFFTSSFEGGFNNRGFVGNRAGQFDRIMQDDFLFATRRYHLHNCRGTDNQARGNSGAGGFMYAVRVEGTEVMEASVRGAGTSIGPNTSQFERNGARNKRGNVVIEIPLPQQAGRPGDRFFITADVPSVASGGITNSTPAPDNHPVVVIRPGGTDRPTTFPFAFGAAPHITDVQPRFGPVSGGQQIDIVGASFMNDVSATIGGKPVTVTNVTDTIITGTTPRGALGQFEVVVTNPDGQADTVTRGFEYVNPPHIGDVQPRSGTPAGGTLITVTGTGFRLNARVTIDGNPATNLTVVSDTEITAETPAATSSGQVDVVVRNEDGQTDTVARGYRYVASRPRIGNVQPRSGPSTAATPLTINGTDFLVGAQVLIGGQAAIGVAVVSTTEITAAAPAQPNVSGLVDVEMINPDGGRDAVTGGFEYIPPPRVTGVSPPNGPAAGGTSVAVNGTGFQPGVEVLIGGTPASVTSFSAVLLDVRTPPGSVGPATLVVRNPDNQSDIVNNGFNYQ